MTRPRTSRLLSLAMGLSLVISADPGIAAASFPGAPGCSVFPATNVWNKRVDGLPVRSDSKRLMRSIGLDAPLHPDFSSVDGGNYGIPYNVVGSGTATHDVDFRWPDESDPGPYPIPADVLIENGSDRHILVVDRTTCRLFELFDARRVDGRWRAGSGAIWDMDSDDLRPKGWTSADAAGLPILPGLVRYDEVAAGAIRHALRFTTADTRRYFIHPARHFASDTDDVTLPPMGLRIRLKKSVDISGFGPQSRVLLRALKRYGMLLADNGSPLYVTGAPDPGWDDDDLHVLHQVTGDDFEVVDTSSLRNG